MADLCWRQLDTSYASIDVFSVSAKLSEKSLLLPVISAAEISIVLISFILVII
jgi:hypothetical protein